ncbi:MAG: hypothetical protein AAB974_01085 [Patescibacteria group bacterium]
MAVLVLAVLEMVPGCSSFDGPPSFDDVTGDTALPLCLTCSSDANCRVFDACTIGGSNVCRSGHCLGDHVTSVDYSCVQDVGGCAAGTPAPTPTPTPSASCGTVGAPPEQIRQVLDRTYCHFISLPPTGTRYVFGKIDVVADSAESTFEIIRGNVVGVRADGTLVPLLGTAVGRPPFTYAGWYMRSPTWYGSDAHDDVLPLPSSPYIFTVPTDHVLHVVLGGMVDMSAYHEVFMMVQARTTRDARYQVGVDYDSDDRVDPGERRVDSGVSDWASCSAGGDITLSSPISTNPTFCGYRPISTTPAPTPTPPPPPPPTGSRDFVAQLGSSFPDYCSSGWVITVWGTSAADNLVSAPGGAIRSSAPASWYSRSSLTMECASPHHWMDWSRWSGQTVSDIAGFGTLTMCGADIRSLVSIQHDVAGDGVRPLINWGSVRGSCL